MNNANSAEKPLKSRIKKKFRTYIYLAKTKYHKHVLAAGGVVVVMTAFLLGNLTANDKNPQPQEVKAVMGANQNDKGDKVSSVVAEVAAVVDIPEGETPTVATITDISKLKDQPLFAKAKNGDMVIVFKNAKKAIIYDSGRKKVVDMVNLNLPDPSIAGSAR